MSNASFVPVDLDGDLNDIADLPGYVVPVPGAYVITLVKGLEQKTINEGKENSFTGVTMEMTINSIMEQSRKPVVGVDDEAKDGDIASVMFKMDNEFGAGKFKEVVKVIAERIGTTKTRACMEASKGMQFLVILDIRKNDDGKKFVDLKKCALV